MCACDVHRHLSRPLFRYKCVIPSAESCARERAGQFAGAALRRRGGTVHTTLILGLNNHVPCITG